MIISHLFKIIAVVAILCYAREASASFGYSRQIVIDHTKVPSTQTSFPVLVSSGAAFSSSLATVANGGRVQNSSGFDIGFYTGSDCATGKLNWETEDYSATTGVARYWVNIASLSSSVDTQIYLCYGDATISTDQSNKTAVWDSNYAGVWHLPNGTALSANDSTSNANNGTLTATPTATTGEIDGGGNFVSASKQYIVLSTATSLNISGDITIEDWIKTSQGTAVPVGGYNTSPFNGYGFGYGIVTSGHPCFWNGNNWVSEASVLNDGVFHHIVAVNNGTNTKFYIDGTIGSTVAQSHPSSYSGNRNIARSQDNNNFVNGVLDEVRITSGIRAADWITAEYRNESSPSTFYTVGSEVAAQVGGFGNGGLSVQGGQLIINGAGFTIL